VAMGIAGSDAALEAADLALVRDDLTELPIAIRLARRTMRTIRQNIAVSLLVKAAFLVLTFVGVTNLWLAVLADMGTSLLVTGNALLLMRIAGPISARRQPRPGD
jgi:Zn2+/Cd2+-exporting ATPase